LPKESFDVWEERYGIHTYTVATTYAALKAASDAAMKFGDVSYAIEFEKAANEMKNAFEKFFYSGNKGYYARALIDDQPDFTVDSATMAIFLFGLKDPLDRKVQNTMDKIMNRLWVKTIGGLARYENDYYQRVKQDQEIPGNPWMITTLWAAQYFLDIGYVDKAIELIKWVTDHAQSSGILSEQLNPYDGSPLSVSPLVWSHAELVITLIKYDEVQRLKESEV
jgi:Glucoamylase and related glycosyl hydrolases